MPILQTTLTNLGPTPLVRVTVRGEVLRFSTASVAMQGTLNGTDGITLAVATTTAVPRAVPELIATTHAHPSTGSG